MKTPQELSALLKSCINEQKNINSLIHWEEQYNLLSLPTEDYLKEITTQLPFLKGHIMFKEDFCELVPLNINNPEDWKAIDQYKIDSTLAKFEDNNVAIWLIQSQDGNFYPKISFANILDDLLKSEEEKNSIDVINYIKFAQDIYNLTSDLSLVKLITIEAYSVISQYSQLTEMETKILLKTVLKYGNWLNQNLSNFRNLSRRDIKKNETTIDLSCTNYYRSSLSCTKMIGCLETLCEKLEKKLDPKAELKQSDDSITNFHDIRNVMISNRGDDKSAITKYFHNPESEAGVVITTSNSGGCHKNIANIAFEQFKEKGISCAIINESQLTENDRLHEFVRIAFSKIYPIVHQQNNMAEYRKKLLSLQSKVIQYAPDLGPGLMRSAIDCIEFPFQSMYITHQYRENFRYLPLNATAYFQVCDYGMITSSIAEMSKEITEHISSLEAVRIIIPSEHSRIFNDETTTDLQELFKNLRFRTLSQVLPYPTAIISEDKSTEYYNSIAIKHGLSTDNSKDRCLIAMGGHGCQELIEEYVNLLIDQYEKDTNANKKPIEIVLICGSNQELQNTLKKKYNSMQLAPGISVKIFGYVENKNFIAMAKSSVLITKPGGGTTSECIQNKIKTLIHYDPAHFWEKGNAIEVERNQLGHIITENIKADLLCKVRELNSRLCSKASSGETPLVAETIETKSTALPSIIDYIMLQNKRNTQGNTPSGVNPESALNSAIMKKG